MLFWHTLFNLWYMDAIIATRIIICEISIYVYVFISLKNVYFYHSNIPKNIPHMSIGSWYLLLSPKDQLSSFIIPFEILPTHYHIPLKPTYTPTFSPFGLQTYLFFAHFQSLYLLDNHPTITISPFSNLNPPLFNFITPKPKIILYKAM